jgi:hypothetical protein
MTPRRTAIVGSLGLTGLRLFGQAKLTAPKKLSSYDPQVKQLLARMTLDEKIGQMTQLGRGFDSRRLHHSCDCE